MSNKAPVVIPVAITFPKATKAQDLTMAQALDAKGDEYKSAGNLAMAKVCYARALNRAIRAGV